MKIVQIGPYPLNANCIKGGVEASIYGLSLEQAKTNQLFVIDIPRSNIKTDFIEIKDSVNIFRFSSSKNNFSAIFRSKTIFSTIQKQNPDVCHIHTTSLFCFIIYLFLKLLRIPTIVTVHGLAHIEKQNLWRAQPNIINFVKYFTQSITEFMFINICPILIVDTQYVADALKQYKKQWKIFRLPICKVIPQGVDDIFFRLKNEPQNPNLFSVGAITKRKGHLFLIKAMKKVKLQFSNFSLSIVGVLSDENYFELMQSTINEMGLKDNVKIYPNATFDEILEFHQHSEIFLLHSEEESQGIVFCEAMAGGKSIVGTNVGGVPWVIKNNINGFLSDFGDLDTFSNNVIKLIGDRSLRLKIKGMNKVQSDKYNWHAITKNILDLYKTVINI